MTLSDKIVGGEEWIYEVKEGFLEVKDVKEFIKIREKELKMLIDDETKAHKNHRLIAILKSLLTSLKQDVGDKLI